MPRKPMSNKEYADKFYSVADGEYELLSEYVNAKTKVKIKHKVCGKIYEVFPFAFVNQGQRCKDCFIKNRLDSTQFTKALAETNGEYSCISEYNGRKSKVTIKHNKCGHEFEMAPNNFIAGSRCPKCAMQSRIKKLTKTHDEFVNEVKELVGNEYKVIGEYRKATIKIEMKHNKCGNIYKVKPNDFLAGHRCPYCYGTPKKETEEFAKEVYKISNGEYELVGEYKTALSKTKFKHNKCGKYYYARPNDFLSGYRCPYCKSSKGEKIIEDILISKNIDYKRQYRIKECRDKKPLPFDFAIMENNKVIALIEYDGELHYKKVDYFGGKKQYLDRVRKDKIKDQYCKNNNIKLIRIPYWEIENIEKIIDTQLAL